MNIFPKIIALSVLLVTAVGNTASSQAKMSEFEGSYIYNNEIVPIAKSRLAFLSSDWEGIYVSTYDSTSALVWEKDFTVPKDRNRIDKFVTSASGADIWTISYFDSKKRNDFVVTWIDALTGDTKTKTYTDTEDFGHVYSTWANNKYFFVMTTAYMMSEDDIIKSPGIKVYRIDKAGMEMTSLKHDMDPPTQYGKVFWEVVHVGEDFYDAYVVTSAGNQVGVKFSRFDNNGKFVSASLVEFPIKEEDHYTRQIAGKNNVGPGIGQSNHSYQSYSVANGTVIELIYPMASVQVAYCAKTSTYYIYGMIGPGEQKKIATVYDGVFLAKVSSDFKLAAYKEYIDVPIMTNDKNFEIHAAPDSRYVKCSFTVDGNPVVDFGAENGYRYVIDQSDLSMIKSLDDESDVYGTVGATIVRGEDYLRKDDVYQDNFSKFEVTSYTVSGNWQYVLNQNFNKGNIKVFSKKAK